VFVISGGLWRRDMNRDSSGSDADPGSYQFTRRRRVQGPRRRGGARRAFETDNTCSTIEKYYSTSAGQTYLAPLLPGHSGQLGPGLKARTQTQCQTWPPNHRWRQLLRGYRSDGSSHANAVEHIVGQKERVGTDK
jgi:hypothetical protein